MVNRLSFRIAASAALMLLLPWSAVTFANGDAGMAACLLLFFVINPLYSIWAGASAGRNMKKLWPVPVITSALFLPGTWVFFDMGETAFLLYSGIYLLLGTAAMLLSALLRRRSSPRI